MPGVCPSCSKPVYHAEQVAGLNNTLYHRACFKCAGCNRRLEPGSYKEHKGEMYCNTCYKYETLQPFVQFEFLVLRKQFGPKGYGYGVGAGTLASEADTKTANND